MSNTFFKFKIPIVLIGLIACVLFFSKARAQLSPDSIQTLIDYPVEDTIALKVYCETFNLIRKTYTEDLRVLIPKMKELAERDSYLFGVLSHYYLGLSYRELEEKDSAQYHFEKCLKLAQEDNDHVMEAKAYLSLGRTLADKSMAMKYYQLALEKIDPKKDLKTYLNVLVHIGSLYKVLDQYDKSEKSYLEALAIATKLEDESMVAYAYKNLSYFYYEMEKYQKALEIDLKLLGLYKLANDRNNVAYQLMNIATGYMAMDKYEASIPYMLESIELNRTFGVEKRMLECYMTIMIPYGQVQDRKKAMAYYDSAKQLVDKYSLYHKQSFHKHATQMFEGLGDYKQAYDHLWKERNYQDSLTESKNLEALQELEVQYESEKKEQELESQQAELEKQELKLNQQKIVQYGLISFGLLVSGFLAVYIRQNKTIDEQKKKVELDKEIISSQAEKLRALDETKSRFFANLSHDFRSPLTLLLGNLNLLTHPEAGYLTNKGELAVAKAKDNTERLLSLTDEIRDLIALEDNKLHLDYKRVEVVKWFDLQVTMFRSAAELKSIDLTYRHDLPEVLKWNFDPKQFEKVIFNLLSNAIKFTEKGGAIAVELSLVSEQELELKVIDTGKGIDSQHLSLVFDRYFQSSTNEYRNTEGLGIGLALVREIVDLHGGQVSATGNMDKGTTITVNMPSNLAIAVEDFDISVSNYMVKKNDFLRENLSKVNQLQPLGAIQDKEYSVLIVDDYPQIRSYIANFLIDTYNIYFASNGKEALLRLEYAKIDLIITDLMMPVMDGFELIDQLNETHSDIPVMVVSARTLASEKQQLLEKGVNDMLSKPFSEEEMVARVRNRINSAGKKQVSIETLVDQRKELQNEMLQKVNDLISSRIKDSGISVADIAETIHASERQTFRLIKNLTGQTPLDYIKDYRLTYAEVLLKKKQFETTSELGQAVGINNVSRFNKLFKAKFGYLPSENIKA